MTIVGGEKPRLALVPLMQEIIIIAGPNGAGKTSFANKHFDTPRTGLVYINADEIARDLGDASLTQAQLNVRAGREMLRRINALIAAGTSFMFETTLASLTYARKIPEWRRRAYVIESVIRQGFAKSADYFERHYKGTVDEWYVWDSLEDEFRLTEAWND